ncbi:MAG: septum formation initiator family protein [Erysipelotrichaceae bacterium]|jgi:cell division protein DivIC|nr:septum formation initiator family protein [Erysipelotrichaceae bacterium]
MTEKKKAKKSVGQIIFSVILSLLMIAGTGYFLWQISREVETTFTLLTDINDAKKELAELKSEQEHLLQQKEQLLDENYVKIWARGEYLITQEGEEIYKLPAISSGN